MTKPFFEKEKDMLFIPFITAGDPSGEATIDLALMLQEAGADAIELGIPYSDPLADGPVIQKASIRALKAGMTLEKAIKLVPSMRQKGLKIPVVIFTYYNLLLQLGENNCIKLLQQCEVNGLLVPDLPFEESETVRALCEEEDIAYISLVAPTTSESRLEKIGQSAQGFLYCVSSLGVTGVRDAFHADVFNFLERVKKVSAAPVAVGFGISSYEQVQTLKTFCDGFIVGSAIVREIEARHDSLLSKDTRLTALEEIKDQIICKFFKPSEVS